MAEVEDHDGRSDLTLDALGQEAKRQFRALEEATGPGAELPVPSLHKRRLWILLAHASALYSAESYQECESRLGDCSRVMDALDPAGVYLPGTRARHAFLQGQVARQLSQYDHAKTSYEKAIYFSGRRLQEATGGEGASGDEAQLAQWTIARCLISLGWIEWAGGRLNAAAALMSAGETVVRSTSDITHATYAELLLAAIARASSGNGLPSEKQVQGRLGSAARRLAEHPRYRYRAVGELVMALYRDPRTRPEARRLLKEFEAGLTDRGVRSKRWRTWHLILSSRVERLDGNAQRARSLAIAATEMAKGVVQADLVAEALIAAGEAAVAVAETRARDRRKASEDAMLAEACDFFIRARERGQASGKVAAAATLHLSDVYSRRRMVAESFEAYSVWSDHWSGQVEHGFVRDLARAVAERIGVHENFFLSAKSVTLNTPSESHIRALQAFLMRRAVANRWAPQETLNNWGMTRSTYNRLRSRLQTEGHAVPAQLRTRKQKRSS